MVEARKERFLIVHRSKRKVLSGAVLVLAEMNGSRDELEIKSSGRKGTREFSVFVKKSKFVPLSQSEARNIALRIMNRGEEPLSFYLVVKYFYIDPSTGRRINLKYDKYNLELAPEKRGVMMEIEGIKTMYRTPPNVLASMLIEGIRLKLGEDVRLELI
ncbi:MAG: hypothetical protein ACP5KE_00090 [Candidatus Methanodesulfokora sp.]|jgi:hypothetical protein|nr:MAG: hypothetical protein C0200_02410 [Candidatus Korarchaeota archaeon]